MRPKTQYTCGAARQAIVWALALALVGTGSAIAAAATAGHSDRGPRGVEGLVPAIPARMLRPGTPIPISPEVVRVSNAWLVSNGRTLVAVYAGAAGGGVPAGQGPEGRFVIVRQNAQAGTQTVAVVNVPQAGAVSIINAPLGAAAESRAQTGTLSFRGASGMRGALNLRTDTISQG